MSPLLRKDAFVIHVALRSRFGGPIVLELRAYFRKSILRNRCLKPSRGDVAAMYGCVYMCVCLCRCVYVSLCVCVCARLPTYMSTHAVFLFWSKKLAKMHMCMHHAYVCVGPYMYRTNMNALYIHALCIRMHALQNMRLQLHTCMHIYIYIYMHTRILYIYIYIYIWYPPS